MNIEVLTGQMRFEDLGPVDPGLTKASFLKLHSKRIQLVSSHGEWATYRGRVSETEGEFVLTIIFKGESLFEVRLAKVGPNSWAAWDEAGEHRRKAEHDSILNNALGQPPGRFQWGEALSVFDAKSAASEIIIRYQQ
jgi:hypothetical protein